VVLVRSLSCAFFFFFFFFLASQLLVLVFLRLSHVMLILVPLWFFTGDDGGRP